MSAEETEAPADPSKLDPDLVGEWKGYYEDPKTGKGTWLTYQFSAQGDYVVEIHPIPGTKRTHVSGTFEAAGGRMRMTSIAGEVSDGTYRVDDRGLTLVFGGMTIQLDRRE